MHFSASLLLSLSACGDTTLYQIKLRDVNIILYEIKF